MCIVGLCGHVHRTVIFAIAQHSCSFLQFICTLHIGINHSLVVSERPTSKSQIISSLPPTCNMMGNETSQGAVILFG